jgi:calcium-dependent protein kinase
MLDSKLYPDIQKFYSFTKLLGSGRYGTVREAVKQSSDPYMISKYAVKSLPKANLASDIEYYRRELEILMFVDHPNIVNFYEVYEDEAYLHLVMELCCGGDLFDHLNSVGTFSEQTAANMTRQLVSAVNHLHTMEVCHRDLKPENFMYVDAARTGSIKLVDFGLAKNWRGEQIMKSKVGSPYFVAPEVLNGEYNYRCDVWSLGVVLYLLLAGQPPFLGSNPTQVYRRAKEGVVNFDGKVWEQVSEHAKDLIVKMLTVDAEARITLDQVARHPFFSSFSLPRRVFDESILTNISNWQTPEKLQKEVLKIVMKFRTPDCIQGLKNTFDMLDSSGSGFVSVDDLVRAFKTAGRPLKDAQEAELKAKFEGSRINYSEFLIAAVDKKRILDDAALHAAFKFLDPVIPTQYQKGYLTSNCISHALVRLGTPVDKEAVFEMMQWGENSKVSFEDFKHMMLQLVKLDQEYREDSILESFLVLPASFDADNK